MNKLLIFTFVSLFSFQLSAANLDNILITSADKTESVKRFQGAYHPIFLFNKSHCDCVLLTFLCLFEMIPEAFL